MVPIPHRQVSSDDRYNTQRDDSKISVNKVKEGQSCRVSTDTCYKSGFRFQSCKHFAESGFICRSSCVLAKEGKKNDRKNTNNYFGRLTKHVPAKVKKPNLRPLHECFLDVRVTVVLSCMLVNRTVWRVFNKRSPA